jgi:hypothetical protein
MLGLVAVAFGGPLLWNRAAVLLAPGPDRAFQSAECNTPALALSAPATMSRRSTRAVTVQITNRIGETCVVQLEFSARNFRVLQGPAGQQVTLPPRGTESRAWVVEPEKDGDFTVLVSAGGSMASQPIEVTYILGLPAEWAELLGSMAAFLFGGVTLKELVQAFREWRRRPEKRPSTYRAWKHKAR